MGMFNELRMAPMLRSATHRRSRSGEILTINADGPRPEAGSALLAVAAAAAQAVSRRQKIVMFVGGHVIKAGLGGCLALMLRRGMLHHLAGNGATFIHDYELATAAETSEHVAENLATGAFGMWQELADMTDAMLRVGAADAAGLGEAAGRAILTRSPAAVATSPFAAGVHYRVAVTAHPLIGGEVTHPYLPDPRLYGEMAFRDFAVLAWSLADLLARGGVFLCVGSQVVGPEVFLKALSWARNALRQRGGAERAFDTAVFDLKPLPADWAAREPAEHEADYYYRPWKTVLRRALPPGGRSWYVCGCHTQTLPRLYREMNARLEDGSVNA